MNKFDLDYQALLRQILDTGLSINRRNGYTFELQNVAITATQFPMTTLRRLNFESILDEFLWEYKGRSNIHDLDQAKAWWQPYAQPDGSVPNAYGLYLRPQIPRLLNELRNKPNSRRHRLVIDSPETQGFPACQPYKTFLTSGTGQLNMTVFSRSSDMVLGFPNDITKDWLYLELASRAAKQEPGTLTYHIASAHIYHNHINEVMTLLERNPIEPPTLMIDSLVNLLSPEKLSFGCQYDTNPAMRIFFNV